MRKIITISREFGSGGREIGKRLADKLGIAYYDKEIIKEISNKVGLSEEYVQNISERGIYPYPIQFARSFSSCAAIQMKQTEVLVARTRSIERYCN